MKRILFFSMITFLPGLISAQQIKETWSEIKSNVKNSYGNSKTSDILSADETGVYVIDKSIRLYMSSGLSIQKIAPSGETIYAKQYIGKTASGDDMEYVDAVMLKDKIAGFYFKRSKKEKTWILGVNLIDKSTGELEGNTSEIETVPAKNVYADFNIHEYRFAVSPDGGHIVVVHQSLNDKENAILFANVYDSKFNLLWKASSETSYQLYVTFCDNPAVDNQGNVYFILRHDRADKKDVVGPWFYYVNAKSQVFTQVTLLEPKFYLQDAVVKFNEKYQPLIFGTYVEDTTNSEIWKAGQFVVPFDPETEKPGKVNSMPLDAKSADALIKIARKYGTTFVLPALRIKNVTPLPGGGYIIATETHASRSSDQPDINYFDVISSRVGADLKFQWMTHVRRCLALGKIKKSFGTVVSGKYVYILYGDSHKNKDVTKEYMYAEKPGFELAYMQYKFEPVEYAIDISTGKVVERKYLPFPDSDLLYLGGTLYMDSPGKGWMLRCTDLTSKMLIGRLEFE
jgi:hypothetical protein